MEDMQEYKIYYNKDGWVCERYPYDLPVDSKKRFIAVDDETFNKTLEADLYFAWRVADGKLSHERYEETPEAEILQALRDKREEICFPIINRGVLWYENLSAEQKQELKKWYEQWLSVTTIKQEPANPSWLFSMEGANGTNTD